MKFYLITYNLFACFAWVIFLIEFALHGMPAASKGVLFLNIAQSIALFEIFHAYKKWVSSPLLTTALQIFSRMFVLLLINLIPEDFQIKIGIISGITIVAIAWSITEIIRYSYYALQLLQKEIYMLTKLRYTLFIFLYPIGITGEFMIMYSVLKWNHFQFIFINLIIMIIALSYLPFFPKLYGYMWKQRRKKIK